ncbi:efflux RND transporter permease subunit [Microbulbifer rhizosphaerae]|uniref:Multidrug efflux pump subunit AcrB n=1 Tax=Microbulbifer rhizosphaerae TaxID=1562603 RepID=A0A7W4Z802_9GAMM|nr:efflux RND transporter permease subunit [Microbulbifer rhizosphaerae]MBB3060283.1 multidrug efflux pump subunit AcrB [Microbulbifer rhizosphaerae]
MNLSQLAFRYRPVVLLATVLMVVYGAFNYFSLPAREDPKITIREAVISTMHPGLPAEQVEEYITKPLEERVRALGEVKRVRSTSMHGRSLIHVEIHYNYFDLDQIWEKVRKQIGFAEAELPEGTQTPVLNDEFGDVAVVTAALTAEDFSQAEQLEMAEHIRTRLYAIEGTKRVELLGVQPQRIYIDLPKARFAELGLSPTELASQLQARNVLPPAGTIETGEQRFVLQVSGEYRSLSELERAEIELSGGRGTVRLGDIGAVKRGYMEPVEQSAYFNGRRAIVFAVSMLDDYSVLDYGQLVAETLEGIRTTLPAGYRLEIMTFQADQVASAVYGVSASVIQTLVIVLGVVVLFLGVRTGLIVGSIIPVVMLITLAVMGFMDLTLERMSLATLVISLGLLVDNAIVIAEDFKTRVAGGCSRDEALRQTGGELAVPLLSSSLTTILVFLPLMLAKHEAGEYARSISIVIAITLLASWLLSLTVTPVLCHRFLKISDNKIDGQKSAESISDRLFRAMSSRYERRLRWVMRHRPAFLLFMLLMLICGVSLMMLVPKKFFPDSDRSQVLVYIDFPSAISATEADRKVQAISARLRDDPELVPKITGIAAYAGFGGPRFVLSLTPIDPATNKGFMVLNVRERQQVDEVIWSVRSILQQEFPGIASQVTKMFLGPSDSTVLEVQVKGPDREVLFSTAKSVETIFNAVPGALDVKQSWEARIPSLKVEVDQAQARNAGLTSSDIARSLRGAINGYQLSQYREGERIIPIVLRYEDEERASLQRLRSLIVYPLERPGEGVPLNQVANVKLGNSYSRIDRDNLVRSITIQGRNGRMTAEDVVPEVQPKLDALQAELPPGHWIEFEGVVAESAEGKAAMSANMPVCLGLIFILLVAQFNSFRRPLLILSTIPLIVIGVALGLLCMRANFGFMVLLGIYSLAGIIINNAIVLIDRIDIDRQDTALTMFEAVIRASVRRLRPIVMSTVTTILGFLPLIIGRDPLFYGMASAMAFGLAIGTLMSLAVVPVLYSYFVGVENAGQRNPGDSFDNQIEEYG